jgi:hypothetical protein
MGAQYTKDIAPVQYIPPQVMNRCTASQIATFESRKDSSFCICSSPFLVGTKSSTEGVAITQKIYLFKVQFLRLGIPWIDLEMNTTTQESDRDVPLLEV